MRLIFFRCALVSLALTATAVWSQTGLSTPPAAPVMAAPPAAISATAEAIYRDAKSRLLQIRTLLNSTSQKSSTGSGFLVSADGLAITNYHVVSQHALEPQTYRMEYVSADGTRGNLQLLAFDVVNDVALVQLDKGGWRYFDFDPRALSGNLPRGERLFSLGNPLDIGFAVMEGNYSGLVERSYNERIHLSGPMNPGMSGGPTLTTEARISGINVAKVGWGTEQVSFLVPAKFAAALLARPRLQQPLSAAAVRVEITKQLMDWQNVLYKALEDADFNATPNGPYLVPESAAAWFTCWARTNADAKPQPKARADTSDCNMQNRLFIAGDLTTGNVEITRTYYKNQNLNYFQFAHFLSQSVRAMSSGKINRRLTAPACQEDIVLAGQGTDTQYPRLRVIWCANAYREFEGLYNVSLMAVSQDRSDEAVAMTLSMNGASYENATRLARRFLAQLKVKS